MSDQNIATEANEIPAIATLETVEQPTVDPAVEAKLAKLDESLDKLVSLAVATLDPKDMTRKYAALGAEFLRHANFQKSSFKAWAKEDYDRAIDRVTDMVKIRTPVTDVRLDTYVRVHAFVGAIKPVVPNVEKLSYFQIANKFLPMLAWDKVELTGEIRKGWMTLIETVIPIQLSDSPLPIKELDKRIAEHKAALEAEKEKKGVEPDKQLAAEQSKREREFRDARNNAITSVTDSMEDALGASLSTSDIVGILESVAKSHNVPAPVTERVVGCDPSTASIKDLTLFINTLYAFGRLKEIRQLHKALGLILAQEEAARQDEARSEALAPAA